MEIIGSILIISLIAAGLAGLLVLSGRFILNYGECKVKINNEDKFTVEGGNSLLEELTREKIFIPSACGGRGTCGYCKCKVVSGAGPVLPTETPFLSKEETTEQIRLSCQVKIKEDIAVEIPEELLSVQQFETVCTDIKDLTYDVKQFHFELKDSDAINFAAGQYAQLLCPEYEGNPEEVYRAYSISSDPEEKNSFELIIRKVPGGICTTYCFEHLKEGDRVYLNGPYGDFKVADTEADMICIAGGSGMAPIKSILHHLKNIGSNRKCTYFFGGNTLEDMFFDEMMIDFEKELSGFKFVPVIATPPDNGSWKGETGLVTAAVQKAYSDVSTCEAYLCGSPGMIDACIKLLTGMGMPEEKIYYDKFA